MSGPHHLITSYAKTIKFTRNNDGSLYSTWRNCGSSESSRLIYSVGQNDQGAGKKWGWFFFDFFLFRIDRMLGRLKTKMLVVLNKFFDKKSSYWQTCTKDREILSVRVWWVAVEQKEKSFIKKLTFSQSKKKFTRKKRKRVTRKRGILWNQNSVTLWEFFNEHWEKSLLQKEN